MTKKTWEEPKMEVLDVKETKDGLQCKPHKSGCRK